MRDRSFTRRALLALALLVAASAAPAAADAEAVQALRAAEARLAALNRLSASADGMDRSVRILRAVTDRVRRTRASLGEIGARANVAAAELASCPAELTQAREQFQQTGHRVLQAHLALRQAVTALSAAPRTQWPRRLEASDEASAALRETVETMGRQVAAASAAASVCRQRRGRVGDELSRFANLRGLLDADAHGLDPSGWQAARAAAETDRAAAGSASAALAALPQRPPPGGEAVARIVAGLQGLPMGDSLGSGTPFATFAQQARTARATIEALGKLADAITYIDASEPAAKAPCAPPRCRPMALERQRLASRQAEESRALDALKADSERLSAAIESDVAAVRSEQQALGERSTGVAANLDETLASIDAWLADADAGLPPFAAAVERERQAADADFSARYAAVHGTAPPLVVRAAPPDPAAAMAPAPPSPISGAVAIDAHAHTTLQRLGAEPAGFRAYTYVIVKSARAKEDEQIRRRLARVIATVTRTVRSSGVAADMKASTHLFCIPTSAGETQSPEQMLDGYDDDLSKQILARVQAGVFVSHSKAVQGLQDRLTRGNGPFLVTLPGRADASNSQTPLLLADLSRYDDAAIADVVNAYMSGLVERFPEDKELWKPPVKVQVALSIVRWASGPGRVVENMVSTATAAPAR